MSTPASLPPTQPYLIRALHEWCTDNGFTPHLAVKVDASVQVPAEYVQHGEIILNISYDATSHLQIGNDFVEFQARFGGKPRIITVPIGRIMAIYARENGQGMAFQVQDSQSPESVLTPAATQATTPAEPRKVENTADSPSAEEPSPAAATDSPDRPTPAKKTTARKNTAATKTRSRRKASETAAESPPSPLAAVPASQASDPPEDNPAAAAKSPATASKRPVLKRIK